MLMIQDRNLTSHTYNRATAEAIAANITNRYLACFQQLRLRLPSACSRNRAMTLVLEIPGSGALLPALGRGTYGAAGAGAGWLGSRAMGRHRSGSDLDLCLIGDAITHQDRLADARH